MSAQIDLPCEAHRCMTKRLCVHAAGSFINSAELVWRKSVPLWTGSQNAFYETVYMTFQCSFAPNATSATQLVLSKGNDAVWPWDFDGIDSAAQQFPSGLKQMAVS